MLRRPDAVLRRPDNEFGGPKLLREARRWHYPSAEPVARRSRLAQIDQERRALLAGLSGISGRRSRVSDLDIFTKRPGAAPTYH